MNRFTGVRSTPDPLAFLLRERQWRDGELRKLRQRLSKLHGSGRTREVHEAAARALTVMRELDALDIVIGMHPIKVDLARLPPVNRNNKRLLPYGGLSNAVVGVLRRHGTFRTTCEIAEEIARRHFQVPPDAQALRKATVKQLNHLVKIGMVERLHSKETKADGFWRLLADED